jgi:hypothetical protein
MKKPTSIRSVLEDVNEYNEYLRENYLRNDFEYCFEPLSIVKSFEDMFGYKLIYHLNFNNDGKVVDGWIERGE